MAKPLLESLFAQVKKDAAVKATMSKWDEKAELISGLLMPCQVRLDADTSRRVSVRAARRTGKSTGSLLVIVKRCLKQAGSMWVIVGLTRASVKRNYWADFQSLNDRYGLEIKFQHQELTATFPTGSKIYFVGADNASEAEKLRGGKYDGVLIDECKSYATAMFEELIQDIIEPALLDRQGQLIIIGTPGDQLAGPFYLATAEEPVKFYDDDGLLTHTSNKPFGSVSEVPATWSLHAWTLRDNVTKFASKKKRGEYYTLWDEALKLKAEKRWRDDHPTWKREYLGLWVANNLKYVYRLKPHQHCYRPSHDTYLGLPEKLNGSKVEWKTVCGIDFGSKDGTAFVIWAYSDTHPDLWEVYSERRQSTPDRPINVQYIANWYKELAEQYGPFLIAVADPAGLGEMMISSLVEAGAPMEAAEKQDKNSIIEMFNNDLDAGIIHVRQGSPLIPEMLANLWLAKTIGTDRKKEDPETPNDTCDAALYSFRWCLHRQARVKPEEERPFSPAWWQLKQQEEIRAAISAAKNTQPTLDKDWWHDS